MGKSGLDSKTFIFYPEFNGMKGKVFFIFFCMLSGLFCLLFNEFFHMIENQTIEEILNILGIMFISTAVVIFVITKLYIKNFKYILTTKRLAIESGIVSKKISNLELWRVIDTELTQTPMQLFFGGCTIRLDTDDLSDPVLYIKGLNNKYGRQVFDLINYLVDRAIKDRLILKSKENSSSLDGVFG